MRLRTWGGTSSAGSEGPAILNLLQGEEAEGGGAVYKVVREGHSTQLI